MWMLTCLYNDLLDHTLTMMVLMMWKRIAYQDYQVFRCAVDDDEVADKKKVSYRSPPAAAGRLFQRLLLLLLYQMVVVLERRRPRTSSLVLIPKGERFRFVSFQLHSNTRRQYV